ncbi:MAG: tRNA (adenosine(37)-N6)-threonylcarbamoyltransferase complex ATPase subunit type 1 TsaE [Ruminococcaceae bacterium]|nr:tRNA (adenosine(37)-N6)-threonylcarbamoyltransferase complex ATPase subunit type 1 TsaE [Oscillospiraceae bacterium]
MIKEFHTQSVEETEMIGRELAGSLDKEKPCFIAMYGDLGVGKTAFVRGLASVLAPTARVKSPTYTVVNKYEGDSIPLYHLDVYRINDEDELYSIGFDDYVNTGICVVEWSENIPESIPKDAIKVSIEKEGENFEKRKITVEVKG